MPGPSMTLSRWAPAMTTLSAFLPGRSAITLSAVRVSGGSTFTNALEPSALRATPWSKLAPTTGMPCVTGPGAPGIGSPTPPAPPTIRSPPAGGVGGRRRRRPAGGRPGAAPGGRGDPPLGVGGVALVEDDHGLGARLFGV